MYVREVYGEAEGEGGGHMAVWQLNSVIPLEEEENRAISPVVFAGQTKGGGT